MKMRYQFAVSAIVTLLAISPGVPAADKGGDITCSSMAATTDSAHSEQTATKQKAQAEPGKYYGGRAMTNGRPPGWPDRRFKRPWKPAEEAKSEPADSVHSAHVGCS